MRKYIFLAIFLCVLNIAKSQTHISGTLYLDIDNGIIDGKIKMNNFPHNKKLSLILHKGMNIKFVKENGKVIFIFL